MRTITLLSAAFCGILISCKENKREAVTTAEAHAQLEKANWLIGSWKHTSDEGTLAENWKKANDSVFKGESYFIVGNDTVFAESVDLTEVNGKLTYSVSVKGQNNGAAVPFVMTSSNNNQMVFENPEHDSPNKITYNKINNDSLVAVISGMYNGKSETEKFAMKRQK